MPGLQGATAAEAGPSAQGGGGARGHGRHRGHGRGRRSGTPAPSSSPRAQASPSWGGHSDGTALEFVVELHGVPRGHLHLPLPFARAMEAAMPPILWFQAYGGSHGAMQVHMESPKRRSMLLGRDWEAFARAHSLEDGDVLRFKLAKDNMLSIKFYGCSGVRLGCCKESSSGAECTSSRDTTRRTTVVVALLAGQNLGASSRSTTP
ncbi:l-ascorbate oxidase-like protein [Hordeum vulgare]|nr:l-ascorbate oxidase-like protein [Hordeum vulgare]